MLFFLKINHPVSIFAMILLTAPFVKTCNNLRQFVIIKDSVFIVKIILMLLIQSLNQEWSFELICNLLSHKCSISHHLTIVLRLHSQNFHCLQSTWYSYHLIQSYQLVHDTSPLAEFTTILKRKQLYQITQEKTNWQAYAITRLGSIRTNHHKVQVAKTEWTRPWHRPI